MKKTVLLLLASLGMTLGFTLSSCSSGGSEDSYEPARAFPGTSFSMTNLTPGFTIEFLSANTAWVNTINFTPGVGRGYKGYFSIDQSRPPKRAENGNWEIWGGIGFSDGAVTSDQDMRKLLGVNAGAYDMVVDRFVLLLEIPSGNQVGAYAGTGQMFAEVRYWMSSNTTEPAELEPEVSISYEAIGVLKEDYLIRPGEEEENDKPFDY